MLLEVKDLYVSFDTYAGEVQAVRGVSFNLEKGEVLAIVGESGCGKSITAQSIMRLVPTPPGRYKSGEIKLNGKNIFEYSEKEMQGIRGNNIGMIFQDPMTSLNPTMTVGNQIAEVLMKHKKVTVEKKNSDGTVTTKERKMNKKEAMARAIEMLKLVEIPNAEERAKQYPHEFSGGMRQRAMIAMALSCSPEILIADEPTTALDVTIQAQVIDLMRNLQQKLGSSIIMITHDLGVVANIAQRVVVMYAGIVVEQGNLDDIYKNPKHPYTWGLLNSVSRLDRDKNERLIPIEGTPPDLFMPPKGCPFADRCDYAMKICKEVMPEFYEISAGHNSRCWLMHPDAPKVDRYKGIGGADNE